MTSSVARPSKHFFYDDSHSLCVSPYAAALRSENDVSVACKGRKILFIVVDECVASRLFPLFEKHRDAIEYVRLCAGSEDEMRSLLSRSAQEGHILVLAAKQYQQMLASLCRVITKPAPVIVPTGYLVLAAPGGSCRVQKAACVCYSTLRKMLEPFQGAKLLLWSHGPMAKHVLGPVLASLGMESDVIGVVDAVERDIALGGRELRARVAGDWIAEAEVGAVLVAEGAGADALHRVHSWLPEYTPILLHASRTGVFESFHSVAFSHSLFVGDGGLLRAEKVTYSPEPPLSRERYAVLHADHPACGDEHYNSITTWSQTRLLGSGFSPADICGKYVNCSQGLRKTSFQPESWDCSVHVFGASHALGAFVDDDGTVASQLQLRCVQEHEEARIGVSYRVVNHGANASPPDNCYRKMCNLDVTLGDHVVYLAIPYWARVEPDSFIRIITAMHQSCLQHGASFSLFLCPELMFAHAPSREEQTLIASFQLMVGEIVDSSEYPVWNAATYETVLDVLRQTGVRAHPLQPYFERPHSFGELHIDIGHVSYKGMKIISDVIYEQAIAKNEQSHADKTYDVEMRQYAQVVQSVMLSNQAFVDFMESAPRVDTAKYKTIGAIVVNCNPFTLGHRHLVQEALKGVDRLYIFVVEEDKSFFSTTQRLEMVRHGVSDYLDRVLVMPSGPGIVSTMTFSEYFTKEETQQTKIDAGLDGLIFASVICQELGISLRYFGEEPYCTVTKEYMRQMARILPIFGVECRIVPRLEREGKPISASLVRSLFKEGDMASLAPLVPRSTLACLANCKVPQPQLARQDAVRGA